MGDEEQQQMLQEQAVDGHVCATFVRTWTLSSPSGSLLEIRETAGVSKEENIKETLPLHVLLLRFRRGGTQLLVISGKQ